jgi:hypothetical protein
MNRHQRRAHASRTRKQARKDIRKVNARLKNEQAAPEFVTGIDPAHGEAAFALGRFQKDADHCARLIGFDNLAAHYSEAMEDSPKS